MVVFDHKLISGIFCKDIAAAAGCMDKVQKDRAHNTADKENDIKPIHMNMPT